MHKNGTRASDALYRKIFLFCFIIIAAFYLGYSIGKDVALKEYEKSTESIRQ
jgi:hypothetical protein